MAKLGSWKTVHDSQILRSKPAPTESFGMAIPTRPGKLLAMPENIVTRRGFLKAAGVLAAPVLVASGAPPLAAVAAEVARQLKVVCVGGHPDDPESGCAGTLSRYAELGHSVTVLYLTRGERGVRGKGLDEAGKIRSAECEKAC
jgi:hypothetical protein